jgi:hypothetical protein
MMYDTRPTEAEIDSPNATGWIELGAGLGASFRRFQTVSITAQLAYAEAPYYNTCRHWIYERMRNVAIYVLWSIVDIELDIFVPFLTQF